MFFQNYRRRKASGTLVAAPNSHRQQINVSHQLFQNVTYGGDVSREINMQQKSEMQQNKNFKKMMNVVTMSMTSKMMEKM